ncbi:MULTISPECIES: hypothetical protein [Pseudoalteromonas]|uniref:hypothetical protein n=1 Tax=Pseudoalteromonas TaxID=53246 RepID=UPI001EF62975|nr:MULTISPECIES: hypothetical protein [Pseudoalteromonas]MCG7561375.1 hypothetical protein [Pseudoalteromonas sp. McH1-42]MEC4087960.1 hypothetical protein [Pseudoalteromonas rubra]
MKIINSLIMTLATILSAFAAIMSWQATQEANEVTSTMYRQQAVKQFEEPFFSLWKTASHLAHQGKQGDIVEAKANLTPIISELRQRAWMFETIHCAHSVEQAGSLHSLVSQLMTELHNYQDSSNEGTVQRKFNWQTGANNTIENEPTGPGTLYKIGEKITFYADYNGRC